MEKYVYPGCRNEAEVTCCMCARRVCETHGNGGIEDIPDLPPSPLC